MQQPDFSQVGQLLHSRLCRAMRPERHDAIAQAGGPCARPVWVTEITLFVGDGVITNQSPCRCSQVRENALGKPQVSKLAVELNGLRAKLDEQ
eukprot:6472577-Amphidinium_carterae.1